MYSGLLLGLDIRKGAMLGGGLLVTRSYVRRLEASLGTRGSRGSLCVLRAHPQVSRGSRIRSVTPTNSAKSEGGRVSPVEL